MTRSRTSILLGAALAGLTLAVPARADAASADKGSRAVTKLTAQEFSAQSRKVLRRARVPIYGGSRYLSPNAVRICNVHYEQQYRPSGTVIYPRMHCYWRD